MRQMKSDLARKDNDLRGKDSEINRLNGRVSTLEQLVNKLRSGAAGARRPSQGSLPDVKDSSRMVLLELGGGRREIPSKARVSLPAINAGGKITMHDSGLRAAADAYAGGGAQTAQTLAPVQHTLGGRSNLRLQIDRPGAGPSFHKGQFGGAQRKAGKINPQQYAR